MISPRECTKQNDQIWWWRTACISHLVALHLKKINNKKERKRSFYAMVGLRTQKCPWKGECRHYYKQVHFWSLQQSGFISERMNYQVIYEAWGFKRFSLVMHFSKPIQQAAAIKYIYKHIPEQLKSHPLIWEMTQSSRFHFFINNQLQKVSMIKRIQKQPETSMHSMLLSPASREAKQAGKHKWILFFSLPRRWLYFWVCFSNIK